jgi:hypothetical protein
MSLPHTIYTERSGNKVHFIFESGISLYFLTEWIYGFPLDHRRDGNFFVKLIFLIGYTDVENSF